MRFFNDDRTILDQVLERNIKNVDDRLRYDEICYDKVQWFWELTRSLINHFRFSYKYARLHNIS